MTGEIVRGVDFKDEHKQFMVTRTEGRGWKREGMVG